MARSWYAYNGIGDPIVPASYNLMLDKPTFKCIDGCTLCAIYATGTGVNPTLISNNLRLYIGSVIANSVSQPSGNFAVKRYAYGKTCC